MNVEQLETYCETQLQAIDDACKAKAYLNVDTFIHQEHQSKERLLTALAETATRAQQAIETIQYTGYAVGMIDTYQAQEEVCEELFGLLLTPSR